MRKVQYLLFVLKGSYICYFIICMTVCTFKDGCYSIPVDERFQKYFKNSFGKKIFHINQKEMITVELFQSFTLKKPQTKDLKDNN